MKEETYQVTGWQYGDFADEHGKVVHYANLFCLAPIEGNQSESFHYEGHKAFIFKCASADVLKDIKPNDHVVVAFNRYGKVSFVKIVTK